jgi:hypothetical protein
MGVVVGRNEGCGTMVKGNDDDEWSSNGAVLWLERRQNGDAIERWGELPRLRWPFYISAGWEFREGGRRRWCWLNASVLTWEGRRYESLLKDEAEATSSSWLHRKESWHGTVAWWHRPEERRHRGREREETTPVGLTRILLGKKIRKIYAVDSVATNGQWKFKEMMS